MKITKIGAKGLHLIKDFEGIIFLAGGLWRHATPLWEGMREISGDCSARILDLALSGPAQEGPLVFAAGIDALLQRALQPSILLDVAKFFPMPMAILIEDALKNWVSATLPILAEEDFETGARLAREVNRVITNLESQQRIPTRVDGKFLIKQRRALDDFCRTTYREIVTIHITKALIELQDGEPEAFEEIETMARIARSLEDTGRRFGAPQSYLAVQEEFRAAIDQILYRKDNPFLTGQQIARLAEILIGRETAERLLHRFRRR